MTYTESQNHSIDNHKSPSERLYKLLKSDRHDLIVLVSYTLITGLISLAVPLAAQALVNTIAAGIFIQPLVVLSLLLFAGLLFGSMLRILKLTLVENLQQRIFARISLNLCEKIPNIRKSALTNEYMPELINRFFDVMNIQKSWAKLLLEGPSALLQVFIGLILMAFYSPYLLAFDLVIITFMLFATTILGTGGLRTGIKESIQKYKLAEWMEDMGRCQTSLKTNGSMNYILERSDNLVINYLKARRHHFSVLFRQSAGTYLFQAIASAGILAIGGWLVINRELTLGQLVAAELVVISVLSALEKLIRNCDTFYDLLTGLDKVGHLSDLPTERSGGAPLFEPRGGLEIKCTDVRFSYDGRREILDGLCLELKPGQVVSLVGASGAGKTTVASILCGLQEPSNGTVEINGMDIRDMELRNLRHYIGLVGDSNEIFEGTLAENIAMGRPNVTHQDVRWALDMAQFTGDLLAMPEGVKTLLVSGGQNLSRGQVQRLLIARAIAERPKLLILDEAFTGIDERTKLAIIDALFSEENDWTILDISHDAEVVMRSSVILVLSGGKIMEDGPPASLAWRKDSEFATLFPDLANQIRRVERRSKERMEGVT